MSGSRVGRLWRPKNKDSKAVMSGYLDVCGISTRASICKNDDQNKKGNSPEYFIVSFGVAEQKQDGGNEPGHTDEDAPF